MSGDLPIAGTYRAKLVKGGCWVAVRIWHGAPVIDGEELERSHRWNVEVDGETTEIERDGEGYRCKVLIPVERYWPYVGRTPIPEAEYRYMKDFSAWAKANAPHLPQASPRSPIDLATSKSLRP